MHDSDFRRCTACGALSITRGYLRNWTITALAALFATGAIAFAVTQA